MPEKPRKPGRFPDTRWSLVGRAEASDAATRRDALGQLLTDYAPALRAFLVVSRQIPSDLAADIVQDFIADKILSRKLLHHADRRRGRFRNLLVKALDNFAISKLSRESAVRARLTGAEFAELSVPASPPHRDQFDREWIEQLVRHALDLMRAECEKEGRQDLWTVFRLRVINPLFDGEEPASYTEIVDRLQIQTPRQAINLLATAKRAFSRHLRTSVGRYVDGENGIEHEIAELRRIVSR